MSPLWTNAINNDLRGAYAYAGSSIFYNGSSSGFTLSGFTSGDVICIALDLDNSKVYFRKNGGNWDGNATHDPATNTGGISISTLVATGRSWFIMAGAGSSTAPVFTLNSGDTSFARTVPSGFTSGWPTNGATATGSVFNTATATAALTFSNSNLTVAATSTPSKQNAKFTRAAISGKYYFEFYVNATAATGVGIANSNTLGDNFYDSATNGAVLYPSGTLWIGGSSVLAANGATSNGTGSTVGFALDLDNHRLWVKVGDGNWLNDGSADPATNTNGKDISALTGYIYPAICSNNSATFQFSANTTDYSKLPAPSGFTVGFPPFVPPTTPRRRRLFVLG